MLRKEKGKEKNCFKVWSFPGTDLDKAEKSQGLGFPVYCMMSLGTLFISSH